jgi:hypothetical protein
MVEGQLIQVDDHSLRLSVDARLLRALRPEAAPDELVAAGLVEPDRDGFRFRHPL